MTEPVISLAEHQARLDEIQALPGGWDEDGTGFPITAGAVANARVLLVEVDRRGLRMPSIFPMNDGGVTTEWYIEATRTVVSVEFARDGIQADWLSVTVEDKAANVTVEDLLFDEAIRQALDRVASAGAPA